MKKATGLAVMLIYSSFLFVQAQKSSFDCNDLNEKLTILKGSFDKLLESYKKQETKTYGSQKLYSTDFTICNADGHLMESRSDEKLMVIFSFVYDTANRSNFVLRNSHIAVFLEELKKVFGDWDFEKESEDHGNLTYYEFREKGYYQSKIKREVNLIENSYYNEDYSISLKFYWKNY